MTIAQRLAATLAAAALLVSGAAHADSTPDDAQKLVRLDMMLMATSVRCRTDAADFQGDYARFRQGQRHPLADARSRLLTDFSERFGAEDPEIALDRFKTAAANRYGMGHPWLRCEQLRQVVRGLADARGSALLLEAADQLLASQQGGWEMASARR